MKKAGLDIRCAIHAANHLIARFVPLHITCSPEMVGTEHTGKYFKREQPARLLVYDRATGKIEHAWYKVSPKATPEKLLAALENA